MALPPVLAGPLGPSIIQGGASLLSGVLGGIFGKKGPSAADEMYARQLNEEQRYKWLVTGAKNAGFNPLTVLGATGGNMQNIQLPPQQNPLADGVGRAIETAAAAYDPVRLESAKLENELLRQQIQEKNDTALRSGKVGMPVVRQTQSPIEDYRPDGPVVGTTRPKMRPHPTNQARIPVYWAGEPKSLLANVADQYGINAFDSLSSGHISEMIGEVAGEGISLPNSSQNLRVLLETGILFEDVPYQNPDAPALDPKKPKNFKPKGGY